jgi:hypothetical protein
MLSEIIERDHLPEAVKSGPLTDYIGHIRVDIFKNA